MARGKTGFEYKHTVLVELKEGVQPLASPAAARPLAARPGHSPSARRLRYASASRERHPPASVTPSPAPPTMPATAVEREAPSAELAAYLKKNTDGCAYSGDVTVGKKSEVDHVLEIGIAVCLAPFFMRLVRMRADDIVGFYDFFNAILNDATFLRVVTKDAHARKSAIMAKVRAKLTETMLRLHGPPSIAYFALTMPEKKRLPIAGVRVILQDHRRFAQTLEDEAASHAWEPTEKASAIAVCGHIAAALRTMAIDETGFVRT